MAPVDRATRTAVMLGSVRVAVVAETFLPMMNGVTHSILRVLQHLEARGDDVLVIAPSSANEAEPSVVHGAVVHRVPSIALARYRELRVAAGGAARIRGLLAGFQPDVVHIASPFILGWRAMQAAQQLGIPTVAIYQTDVPGYFGRYGVSVLEKWAWQRVQNIHLGASRTLAPSSVAINQLQGHGIPRVQLWPRGVDTQRFHPRHRDEAFRRRVAPGGQKLIGYVGRLAIEKQVEDLAALTDIPGSRLVIIGDGPQRAALQAALPGAYFTGFLGGPELAAAVASLDLFVHPGELETFCQTIQESMASAVPVVATGRGGPIDLVDSGSTGWLYQPGDLTDLRNRVTDLLGDDRKRQAFADAAFIRVQDRTWESVCDRLLAHYDDVINETAYLPAGRGRTRPRHAARDAAAGVRA